MTRIRNEERWIHRNLERTFLIAETVVIWDDGSTDRTEEVCRRALGSEATVIETSWGWLGTGQNPGGKQVIHFLHSPFRPAMRPKQGLNEIRDKNVLWEYVKAKIPFDHVLCLDGDEMLSRGAVVQFDTAIKQLEQGGYDILTLPIVYLWDREDRRRVDGIYGQAKDGLPKLRCLRIFTIRRLTDKQVFGTRMVWKPTEGGFHCGSIPMEQFRPGLRNPRMGVFKQSIIHFGYMDAPDRRRKFEWYNQIDPGNKAEGEYRHVIGEPNIHAPGPVKLISFDDNDA